MKLEIIGEPNLDFYSDLQKLAIKYKVAIMTMQQKKKKSFLSMKEVAESFKTFLKCNNLVSVKIPKVVVRAKPHRKYCPRCTSTDLMIYDQERDCCNSCDGKWKYKIFDLED